MLPSDRRSTRRCEPSSTARALIVAASTSQMGRFETEWLATEWLATEENFAVLNYLPGAWIDRVHDRKIPKIIILDMDSSVSPTHGGQEGSAYNGHFGCPAITLFSCSTSSAILSDAPCSPGVHSSSWLARRSGTRGRPVSGSRLRRYFRGDAAFASADLYFLEAATSTPSVSRPTRFFRKASSICDPPRRSPAQPCSPLPCQLQLSGIVEASAGWSPRSVAQLFPPDSW